MARGKLIVFEGLDRSGKSTQCERLVSYLTEKGVPVKHRRFPDRTTPIGQMINNYLQGQTEQEDHVIHLLFSANRWEAVPSIEADINAGITVIIDRYYYSGCVYSAAKNNPSLSLSWSRHPEEGLPRPDLCLFLDISAEDAAKRGGWGEERYEKQELQDRVRQLFADMRATDDGSDFVTINAGQSLEEVASAIRQHAESCIEAKLDSSPLRRIQPW
ncbi:thymidylate kinase [Aureobasidium pullulans]|uniref:Thymidylate kinase n=2 Tax=Aureobasidium pullulans TaxID=5580 RepID=A0A074XMB9_AURPU|nr:thymidylate kinase [Aureobasidium pullulans EXF-150]THV96996.1 thymidylate kinase [Aureobasidium pullulans]KEQ86670.1 thymidylate kinase [Aureobasidium pullulans EXF-150]THW69860.1 thymidylate kinase [Aureobasidium pullulans]THY49535.1 thymidylate kinase [Aureobasidium pullulans]THZ40038.1 thymidylate kinase [Aureobasidium pullulans]